MTIFRAAILCICTSILPCFALAAGPRITAKMEASNKISLAGNQRLVSQEIIRSVCMVLSGNNAAGHAEDAWIAASGFEATLQGLSVGSNELGLAAETNAQILTALDDIRQVWRVLGPATRQIASGDRHSVPVRQVLRLDSVMRGQTEVAVELVEAHYAALIVPPDLARAINLISRQRMLVAQASKDACFISIGLSPAVKREELADAVAQMEDAIALLAKGDENAGIAPPPNGFIPFSLKKVGKKWAKLRIQIDQILAGEVMSAPELQDFGHECAKLSKSIQAIAVLYIKS